MKGKRMLVMLAAVMVVCCVCIILAGAAGTSSDPLISVSYLYRKLTPQLQETVGGNLKKGLSETEEKLKSRLDALWFPGSIQGEFASQFISLDLYDGDVIELKSFASFVLLRGEAKLMLLEGEILDLSTGGSCSDGSFLSMHHRYIAAENTSARIRVYGSSPAGLVDGEYRVDHDSLIPTEERYMDVEDDFWAAPYTWRLSELGIVNGVEEHRFAPREIVTRGSFVTILGRMHGVDSGSFAETPFTDVSAEDWYGPYVAWAAEYGVTLGFDDGSFHPGDNINREQMAVMLFRYMNAAGIRLNTENHDSFKDEETISDWALEAVNNLRDMGLMNGRGDNCFEPKGTATRAEICAVVYRLMEMSGITD